MFHHSIHGLTCKNRKNCTERLIHTVHDKYRRKLKIILATPSSKKHPAGTVSWKLRLNSGKKREMAQEETPLLPSGVCIFLTLFAKLGNFLKYT